MMRGFVRRRVPAEVVDDVVQAIFVGAWRKASLADAIVRSSSDHQRAWLYTAARLEIAAYRRASGRRGRLVERIRMQSNAHTLVALPAENYLADSPLQRSLDRLSPADRSVVQAAYFDELSSTELADRLGCSPEAARQRLSRALDRLRAAYRSESQASA